MSKTKISDPKKIEKKVFNQNEASANIMEAMPYIFYIIDVNDYTIKESNSPDKFKSPDKINCYTLFHKREKPCEGKDHQCPIEQVKKAGKAVTVEHLHFNHTENPSNYEVHCVPLFGRNNKVVQVIAISNENRKQTENSLALFEFFVEASGQGFAMGDLDGKVTYINPALCRMLEENNPNDTYGKGIADYYPETLRQKLAEEIFPEVMQVGQWKGEMILMSKNGKLIPTYENIFLIRDKKGNPLCIANVITDMTEHKKTEKELEKQTHDLGERVKELNCLYGISALVEKPGISLEEIYKGTVDLISPSWQYPDITCARITIDGQEFTSSNFKETEWTQSSDIKVHGQCVGSLEVGYLENRPESDEGPFLKEERHLINAITTRMGHVIERKQAEKALRASENKYKTLLENLPQKIFFKDKASVYVSCNENYAKDLKIQSDEIAGMTDYDFFSKEFAEKYRTDDRRLIECGKTEEIEEKYIQDGKELTVNTVKIPVGDENGNIVGLLGVFWDITERKQAEIEKDKLKAQLLQSEKMASIGQLAAGVAHEINNPVGYVYSNLNTMNKYLWKIHKFLNSGESQNPETKKQLEEMIEDFGDAIAESLEGADRVKKIVADLKSLSHTDKGKNKLADINRGLESTLNIVWNQLKYTCKVEKDFGDLPVLCCNINQLNQVFMNMLVNAGQAITGSSGLIKIKTRADEKNIYISFKDNGVGIPQENLNKLFDPFFTTKEVGKGTGLGLNLAYEIIKKHDGQVDIKSEVGVGSEFIITLPITEAEHDCSKSPTA